MISRPTEQADAERAVMAFKHGQAVRVMRAIVELALNNARVFPGDLPADLVGPEDRQGVLSNAWGSLRALEIIRPISPRVFDDTSGIVAGKKRNPHPEAKGRWVMVYELADRSLARTWLDRNSPESSAHGTQFGERFEQRELLTA
jgi:hypothetical protein